MNYNIPEHYSHKLELKLDKYPARISDRTNWRFQLPGILFGTLLFMLGIYELLKGFRTKSRFEDLIALGEVTQYQPLINPAFFDVVFMAIGLGMIAASIMSYIRYRKIIYDGKTVIIGNRPVFGPKVIVKENVKNYQGVRFRIEFFQSGLINKNKYIIELYHKDVSKIIPLYISTSPKNIRRIWEKYARGFNLPVVYNTDEGLSTRDVKNLDKPLRQLAEEGYIIDDYDERAPLPDSLAYVRRKDKIVLKVRKIIWDAYNIMAWIAIFVVGLPFIILLFNRDIIQETISPQAFYGSAFGAAIIIIAAIFVLFRKEKLVIKKQKIVNTHKYMLFSTKHDEMSKEAIESIEVTENPASGRFYVSIIGDDKTISFGVKLPIEDLRWVKKFLIHEVI